MEKSCVVWHSKLTEENETDLERVQKAAVRIILNKFYENYDDALETINLQKLKERREELCLNFAKKCLNFDKTKNMFPINQKQHDIQIRNTE